MVRLRPFAFQLTPVDDDRANWQRIAPVHAYDWVGGAVTAHNDEGLFDALIAKYKTKVTALQNAIKGIEDQYVNDPSNRTANPSTGVTLSLFTAGANQSTSWRPWIGSVAFCSGGPH
jgi:hypothetical protein